MSSIDPSLAFKQVAHSIKNNSQNHLYITSSLGVSNNKSDAISFNELRKTFVDLHQGNQLTFKQANRLQKSFRIIHQDFKKCRKENLIKKIARLWISRKASRSMKKVPTPIHYFAKHKVFGGYSKGKSNKHMTKTEAGSIFFYTTHFYTALNNILRSPSGPDDELAFVARAMNRGLEKLPEKEKKLYRGIAFSQADALSLNEGDTYSDLSFMSFSSKKRVAVGFIDGYKHQKLLFKVKKSKNAKDISSLSQYRSEKEHLYAPNQKFKIVNIKEKTEYVKGHNQMLTYSRVLLEEI